VVVVAIEVVIAGLGAATTEVVIVGLGVATTEVVVVVLGIEKELGSMKKVNR
jgi:hypothetical protein